LHKGNGMQQPGVRTDADAMTNNWTVATLHGARAAAAGKKRRQWLVTLHAKRVWRRTAAECCEGGGGGGWGSASCK
jgi:hypothetical protein